MNHRSIPHRIACMTLVLCMLFLTFAFSSCTQPEPSDSEAGYAIVIGNTTIRVDDDAAPVLSSLGAWKLYDEDPSCQFDGLDKIYVYGGFRIQTYPENGGEFVYSVELLDDSIATPEGIVIGSSRDAVLEKYGTDMKEEMEKIIYTDKTETMQLKFLIRNGKVTNIQYVKLMPEN